MLRYDTDPKVLIMCQEMQNPFSVYLLNLKKTIHFGKTKCKQKFTKENSNF